MRRQPPGCTQVWIWSVSDGLSTCVSCVMDMWPIQGGNLLRSHCSLHLHLISWEKKKIRIDFFFHENMFFCGLRSVLKTFSRTYRENNLTIQSDACLCVDLDCSQCFVAVYFAGDVNNMLLIFESYWPAHLAGQMEGFLSFIHLLESTESIFKGQAKL